MTPSEKLEKIYSSLPSINCKRLCHRACTRVPIVQMERDYMKEELGVDDFPNFEDFVMQVKAIKETGLMPDLSFEAIKCPKLTVEGNCSIHPVRPLICRLFGLVKKMKCPFGCVPTKWVSDKEAKRLYAKIRKSHEQKPKLTAQNGC